MLILARLLLSVVLVVAGVAKLIDRGGARQAMLDFGVPVSLAPALALMLPVLELGTGVALFPAVTAWWGALAALGLFVVFLAVVVYQLARGRRPDCHCFGQLQSAPIGPRTVARNAVLVLVATYVVLQPARDVGGGLVTQAAALLVTVSAPMWVALAALVVAVANLWLLTHLLHQNGRILLRLEALEGRLDSPAPMLGSTLPASGEHESRANGGPPIGSLAPLFALPSLDGEMVSLDALRAGGKPLVLLFVDPGCGPCAELMPEVATWQREHAGHLSLALVSRGKPEANARKLGSNGVGPVLLQTRYEVAERYHAIATPSAVLLDGTGRVAAAVATGADAIRRLVAHATRPAPAAAAQWEGVAVGAAAPMLRLSSLDGTQFDLADRLGRSTVLLFWDPRCGFCQRLLPELRTWARAHPDLAQDLVLVSTPNPEANRGTELPGPLLLDEGFKVRRAFGAAGTPSAVLVNATARVETPIARGGTAVLALLARLGPSADSVVPSG